ncbi:MAG: AI-2E family transporter [Candidatus Sumerlaeaceae bacterium]|nr:AI-2E family transporter [Candidatus Sumerlaeaceae bacterium]
MAQSATMENSNQKSTEQIDLRIRRSILILLQLAIGGALVWLAVILYPIVNLALTILSPFIVALIVAYIFNPLVRLLQLKLGLGRAAGVAVTYGLILSITLAFFAILVPTLYVQLRNGTTQIIQHTPEAMDKASQWLHLQLSGDDIAQIRKLLQSDVDQAATETKAGPMAKTMVTQAAKIVQGVGSFILNSAVFLVGFFGFVAFVALISFYFLLDYSRISRLLRVMIPEDKVDRFFDIWRKIDSALGGYLRGQLTVCLLISCMYTGALMLMGLRSYAVLIGFAAGFGNLIPYFGPIVGGVPTALWVIFGDGYPNSHDKIIGLGLVGLLTITIQSLDGFFFQPRLVGKNAELHPLLVLLALLVGGQFGLGGLIIAVPSAVVARVLYLELFWNPLIEKAEKRYPEKQLADKPAD